MEIKYNGYLMETIGVCPILGSFIGWKKALNRYIVKLEIPEDAKRLSTHAMFDDAPIKCRCDKAKVLAIYEPVNSPEDPLVEAKVKTVSSCYDTDFKYTVGKTVQADYFDAIPYHVCSNGIHFFCSLREAIDYEMW